MKRRDLGLSLIGALLSVSGASAAACTPKVAANHLVQAAELQMAVTPTVPPIQYVDSKGELQGLNIDIGKAVAAKMCLEPVYIRIEFPPMMPGLQVGRYDAINTGLFWTEARSKLFYLVPYGEQGNSIYALPDSKLVINRFEDLAGHVVGTEMGNNATKMSAELSDQMVARGLKPVQFRAFSSATETVAALRAGQVEAAINGDVQVNDLAKRKIAKVLLKGLFDVPFALAFRDKMVAEAAVTALDELKADGTYDKLFDQYGVNKLELDHFAIRGSGPG